MKTYISRLFRVIAVLAALCGTTAQGADLSIPVAPGWNLLGNTGTSVLDVASVLGDGAKITTVWKWNSQSSSWAFYSPSLAADGTLAPYAAGKGYQVLSEIAPGEGFWVNAAQAFTLDRPGIVPFSLGASELVQGWNLVATGDALSPAQLDTKLGGLPGTPSFSTMWAWNSASKTWYFNAPSLAASEGLAAYVQTKGYLDFGSFTTENGLGFWINSNVSGVSNAVAGAIAALRGPYAKTSVDAVVTTLTQSGITVTDNDGISGASTANGKGLQVMQFQARSLALEIASKSGHLGSQLNSMTPPIPLPPDGTGIDKNLTWSLLIAAYVKSADSFGAKVARGIMGDIDLAQHATYRYPTLVIYTFMQEVMIPLLAEMQLAESSGPVMSALSGGRLAATALAGFNAGDPCGSVNQFLDDLAPTVSAAVSSVGARSTGFWSNVFSVAAVAAGVATNAAVNAVKSIVRHTPAVTAARNAMTAAHALSDLNSMFSQWNVQVTAAPGGLHKKPGTPDAGTFTLTIDNGGETPDWPQAVRSCAQLLDIPLPNLNSADGATVTWEKVAGFDALAIASSNLTTTIAGGMTTLDFNTATESQAVHENPGSMVTQGAVAVNAKVSLPGMESMMSTISSNFLSGAGATAVSAAATPASQLVGPRAAGETTVEHHVSPPAVLDIEIVDDATFRMHAVSCTGIDGPYTGNAQVIGDPGGTATITPFSFNALTRIAQLAIDIPMSGTCNGNYAVNGPMTVNAGGSPSVDVNAAISGTLACPFPFPVTLSAPAIGSFPLKIGPTSECP